MRHQFNHSRGRKAHKFAALAAMAGAREGAGPFGPQGPFGPDGPFGPLGPGGPAGPQGGGRRGRRGMFDREHLRLLLLKLIEAAPQHGYELIRSLEDRSGGRYAPSPGVIYPTLSMLADEGLIVEQATDDARRRYAITPEGAKVLADQAETLAMIDARLEELARSAKKERPPQIERAAANLSMALRQRMQQGASDDLAHDIAAILDDAARRIERL